MLYIQKSSIKHRQDTLLSGELLASQLLCIRLIVNTRNPLHSSVLIKMNLVFRNKGCAS